MSAWSVPSLLVQLPVRCCAIMKTSLGRQEVRSEAVSVKVAEYRCSN